MSRQPDSVNVIRIINPRTNEDYFLKNAIGKVVAFEDRDDAIASAKRHIKKRSFIECFEVYWYPYWVVRQWYLPVMVCYGTSKIKGVSDA
jgi:hypothetical protein